MVRLLENIDWFLDHTNHKDDSGMYWMSGLVNLALCYFSVSVILMLVLKR